MANSRKRMNVVSLSFDGCVYHPQYDFKFDSPIGSQVDQSNPFVGRPNDDLDRLLDTNQPLIQRLANEIHAGEFQEVVMMLGCRQDGATEEVKMRDHQRGSVVQDLPVLFCAIQDNLNNLSPQVADIRFGIDQYLLADTYGVLSNFDFASSVTQDAIKYYSAVGKIAADQAEEALEAATQQEVGIKKIAEDIKQLNRQIKEEKSYILKIEKETRRSALLDEVPRLEQKLIALRETSKAKRKESMDCQEKVRMYRGIPYGYGLKANADPAVVEIREKSQRLKKMAAAVQWKIDSKHISWSEAVEAQKQRDAWNYAAYNLQYESQVYTRAMQVGSTWHAILRTHEIARLRKNAKESFLQMEQYENESQKLMDEVAGHRKLADDFDRLAREAIIAGDDGNRDEMYAKADWHEKKILEIEAMAQPYSARASRMRQRAQDFLDEANLLCLGPSAAACYVSGVSPREAMIRSGNDPHKQHDDAFRQIRCFADESKLTLLYAQLHRAAANNPSKEIVFDFYEGKNNILIGLAHFFGNNRDLIPDNLTLRLHQYAGAEPRLMNTIFGRGPIDYNYHHNIRFMVESAGFQFIYNQPGDAPTKPTDDCWDVGVLVGFWVQKNLAAFKKQRQLLMDTIEHWMTPYFLGTFDPKIYLGELYKDIANFPEDADHLPLKNALALLYEALQADFIQKVSKGVTPRKIENSTAYEMVVITKKFLDEFNDPANIEARGAVTERFVERYEKLTRLRNAGKVIAVIFAAIVGMVVGAAIGLSIGFAAGLLTGPGAPIAGLLGMMAGATVGAIAVIGASSLLVGGGFGVAAKFKLFGIRPDGKSMAMKDVMTAGAAYAEKVKAIHESELNDGGSQVVTLAPAL